MSTLVKKRNKIEFYDSIKDLPIRRYQQYNKYLMIATDIGSDFSDFNQRTTGIIEYLSKGLIDSAIKEIENRKQTVYNAYEAYNPKHYALALLVKSINGLPKTDISDQGLDELVKELDYIGVTYEDLNKSLSEVKKKSIFNWKLISKISFLRRAKQD